MTECFYREALIEAVQETAADKGLARLSFASEMPVYRHDRRGKPYFEVLSHAPGDANLGFLNRSGIVLQDHDDTKEIGEVIRGSARVEPDKKCRCTIRITDSGWRKKLSDRAAIPVSVGYSRTLLSETRDDVPTRYFSWSPYEVSLLTAEAADPTVGIGRSLDFMTRKNSLETLLELALSGSRKNPNEDEPFTREALTQEYSLVKALSGWGSRGRSVALTGLEREVHASGPDPSSRLSLNGTFVRWECLLPSHRRDMTVDVFGTGGALVQDDMHPAISLLRNKSVCLRLGANAVPGLRGDFVAPQVVADVTPQFLTETQGATASQFTFAQSALTPRRVSVTIPVSLQLLQQSSGVQYAYGADRGIVRWTPSFRPLCTENKIDSRGLLSSLLFLLVVHSAL